MINFNIIFEIILQIYVKCVVIDGEFEEKKRIFVEEDEIKILKDEERVWAQQPLVMRRETK